MYHQTRFVNKYQKTAADADNRNLKWHISYFFDKFAPSTIVLTFSIKVVLLLSVYLPIIHQIKYLAFLKPCGVSSNTLFFSTLPQ